MNFFPKYFVIMAIIFCSFHHKNIEAGGKKLGQFKMILVSLGIADKPDLMVNAWTAKEEAQSVLGAIENFKAALLTIQAEPSNAIIFVQKYRDRLIIPIELFLVPFRIYKKIVIPLLKESLGADSMLERLFNADSSISIKSFFDKEVQSIDSLTAMSNEFITFFNDLEESLSDIAKNKYKEALAKKITELDKAASQQSLKS